MLAVESADSIHTLYKHFLSKLTEKSLNAFYYTCSYAKIKCCKFMNVTTSMALQIIPENLCNELVFLCIDDMIYVTAANKTTMTRRLFFSTIEPESIRMACAWQEKAPLNQTCSEWMQYVPLFVYSFRWNIEVSYYEQKNF